MTEERLCGLKTSRKRSDKTLRNTNLRFPSKDLSMASEEIVETIIEESELDKEEIEEEVEEKMEEFSGLVSEEGALHLVAKEHGIDLSEAAENDLKIENMVPEMRNVKIKARVTNVLEPNTFERDDGDEGKVQNVILGDDTGTIRLTLWDEQTEIAEKVGEGDAIKIASAYTVEDNRGNAELRLGDEAQVKMADEDEVPEVETSGETSTTTEAIIREVRSENASYRIKGMLVNVYTSNPFYNRCPECGNSVKEDESGNYQCQDHGEVEEPDKALAVSAVIDDGTGNIRVVFFREQARKMLEVDEEIEEEGSVNKVEKAAGKVIGKQLEIEGRARYNDYFGTLELLANEIREVEPEEEIEKLVDQMEA